MRDSIRGTFNLAGKVGIPLLLFLIAQGMLLSFHLFVSKRGRRGKKEADVPKKETGVGPVLWAKKTMAFHGIPIACGVCLTFFFLFLEVQRMLRRSSAGRCSFLWSWEHGCSGLVIGVPVATEKKTTIFFDV